MNDTFNTNFDDKPIEPPKVSWLNSFKYKLGYFQGKSKVVTTVVGVALMSGVSLFVAYASLNNKNISLNPSNFTGAANPSCYLSLTRATPPPPTSTPTGSPVATSCTNWLIDEHSGTSSELVKLDSAITSISSVKVYDCTVGPCDFENMTNNPVTQVLYSIPNQNNGKKILYSINTKANDGIADGTLTPIVTLNKDIYITGISFRRSDNSLWAWVRAGGTGNYAGNPGGLYKIDMATGQANLVMTSTLLGVEDIAWDAGSKYLYITRTPHTDTPKYSSFELHRYDPATNSMAYYAPLPGETDSLSFATSPYLSGYLVGAYRGSLTSTTPTVYTYNVATKAVVKKYVLNSSHSNLDAMALCLPN